MPVSRETPPAPPVAQGVFSHALPQAEAFAALLAGPAVERGLMGPRETPRLWERHLVNCALLGEIVPEGAAVCDVGSGAGLPGLVLALSRPDLSVTLVEPLLRRCRFLEEAVASLGLGQVRVLRARAEELHDDASTATLTPDGRGFDVVTSRAVAPLPRLLDWSMPLVRAGGVLAAMKGASAAQELVDAAPALRRHHAGRAEVLHCGVGVMDPPTTVIRVEATGAGGLRSGVPVKPRGNRSGKPRGASGDARPNSGARARSRRRGGHQ
jgi:16S rRNA (guanine527-N7)-methyltransferase